MFAVAPASADEAGLFRPFDALCHPAWPIDVDGRRCVGVDRAAWALPGDDAAAMKRLTPAAVHPPQLAEFEACRATVAAERRRAADDQCHRILLNLVRDAHAAGASHLRVDAEPAEGGVRIPIAADGPGLPETCGRMLARAGDAALATVRG